jgi:hypothetical protein
MLILFLICFKLVNRCETTTQKKKKPFTNRNQFGNDPQLFCLGTSALLADKSCGCFEVFLVLIFSNKFGTSYSESGGMKGGVPPRQKDNKIKNPLSLDNQYNV